MGQKTTRQPNMLGPVANVADVNRNEAVQLIVSAQD